MREAELAIHTFHLYHDNARVFVICDEETRGYLQSRTFYGPIEIEVRPLVVPQVTQHNKYHRSDAILWKMDALNIAVQRYGDSVFFDADIVFLEPLSGPDDCEVALSHNLTCMPADKDGSMHGIFNAGLIWTCNPKFANWWKSIYLRNETFYEQGGLNLSPRIYRTSYFDIKHNFGFWRGPLLHRNIGSAHVHLDTALDATMPPFMHQTVPNFRREVWKRLTSVRKPIGRYAREIFKHPQKIFFIHYGKAGGIYTNEVMHKQCASDYEFFDSWKHKLGRDWTSQELFDIIDGSGDNPFRYLHQHHINVTDEHIARAREKGWTTFTFLRNPKDLICSLYFWRLGQIEKTGIDQLFYKEDPTKEYSMAELWERVIRECRKLWALPSYIHNVDHVALFSDDNLAKLLIKLFGYRHSPMPKMNASKNPGLEQCVATNSVTQKMLTDLELTPEYQEFESFVTRSL